MNSVLRKKNLYQTIHIGFWQCQRMKKSAKSFDRENKSLLEWCSDKYTDPKSDHRKMKEKWWKTGAIQQKYALINLFNCEFILFVVT